ncbi:hypothetical protein BN946_scf184873.g15 [Trametes cinnabarina]|uniref:ASX DEUBAD domain-containing protein n=1 Tax=Pycnoporus cinnabarinus TaxID=5643 RepID=A0A060SP43_PYCCI|nr:hypothetical protein BN946_scf184873.g15 [Trametes cinnabarina]
MDADTKPTTTRAVRRSTRTPAKSPKSSAVATAAPPESPAAGSKRKARGPAGKTPAEKLEYLLTNPKSKLTKVDISVGLLFEVVNYTNFLELSEEAQNRLCALLPPTAFSTYSPSVCPTHPDSTLSSDSAQHGADRMDVDDAHAERIPATLDPTVFTSPFFLSAAHTFQDHLFSGWLGKKASDDLETFKEGVRTGQMHADWKDDAWERDHHQPLRSTTSKKKRTESADLVGLVKRGLLQQGDILAYKRSFPALNVTVEKDVLLSAGIQIDRIVPETHYITGYLLSPGTVKSLPPTLLVNGSQECDTKVLSIGDVADPVALERGVLDVDGRVRPSDKYEQDAAAVAAATGPSADPAEVQGQVKNLIAVKAWKSFTLWRWREEMKNQTELQVVQERGGRERVATLFYLRSCCVGS